MSNRMIDLRGWLVVCVTMVLTIASPETATAQGFISPSIGYNFAGDSGCQSATDCEDKNWNLGASLGTLGLLFGFEAELTYENKFLGETSAESGDVMTLMGNLMLAPKIAIVRPYGLAGLGLIRTTMEDAGGAEATENQFGWTVGAGLIVHLNRHVGVKGDIRHYHAFQSLEVFGFDLARDENKLDFGRAALGVVISF